jgi:hypothetical protein
VRIALCRVQPILHSGLCAVKIKIKILAWLEYRYNTTGRQHRTVVLAVQYYRQTTPHCISHSDAMPIRGTNCLRRPYVYFRSSNSAGTQLVTSSIDKYLPRFANVYLYASISSSVMGESDFGVDPLNRCLSRTMS